MKEGIYFIYSRYPDGRYIYKIGMSKNLEQRMKQYPQNYEEVMTFEHENSRDLERKLLTSIEELCTGDIKKCNQGNEYFESADNCVEIIRNKINDTILKIVEERNVKHYETYLNTSIKLKQVFLPPSIGGSANEFCGCTHHMFAICLKKKVIGRVVLECAYGHIDSCWGYSTLSSEQNPLELQTIELINEYDDDRVRKLVLLIIENKFFWNFEYYTVSKYFYKKHSSFLKENGFIYRLKFNEVFRPETYYLEIKKIYETPLKFLLIETDFSLVSGDKKPSEYLSSFKYENIDTQTIYCSIRGDIGTFKSGMEFRDFVHECFSKEHPCFEINLSKPWVARCKYFDSLFCITYNDEFIFKPIRIKYYRNTDMIKEYNFPINDINCIYKIFKIKGDYKVIGHRYPNDIINYCNEVKKDFIDVKEVNKDAIVIDDD